jgi:hypothetical protein
VDRPEDLEQDEHDADERQRRAEVRAVLDRADERAHRDREGDRQESAQEEDRPPQRRERAVRARQHREELPLVAGAESCERRGAHGAAFCRKTRNSRHGE